MKKKKVKAMLYEIRGSIIDEIGSREREEINSQPLFIQHWSTFDYGYRRGLTEAAMIMLDKIYEMFPEEEQDERGEN